MPSKKLDLRPPAEVANKAKLGLVLRRQFKRSGTPVGIARARDLKNRRNLSRNTINRMVSYFQRHEVDKMVENFGDENNPSNGYIAWLLWGGNEGYAWAKKKQDEFSNK